MKRNIKLKIIKSPVFYLIAVFVLLSAFNIVDVSKAFNKPTANPYSGTGAVGAASGAPTNWVRLTSTGKIGIGTTTPSYVLSISSSTDDLFNLTRVSASYPTIFKLGTDSALIVNSGNSDILTFKSGNVGIGTTTPASKLSIVNGGITIDGVSQIGFWNSGVPQNNISNIVASTTIVGVGVVAKISIGTDGLPVIAYLSNFDAFTAKGSLSVMKCGNIFCTSGNTVTVVDSATNLAAYLDMAIGIDGFPIISYYNGTNKDLKIAKCGNAACSSGNTITTIDSANETGANSSITIGTDGLPIVSYGDETTPPNNLKILKCGNSACSSGNTITTVDSDVYSVTACTSIAIGNDGLPRATYCSSGGNIKFITCGNASCSSGNTTTTIAAGAGVANYTSLTIGRDNLPVLSYRDNTARVLNVLKCGNSTCTSGNTTTTVSLTDAGGGLGFENFMTLGKDGLPLIAYYYEDSLDVRVVKCGDDACATSIDALADSNGYANKEVSITIGSDGLPILAYYVQSTGDLKVTHCANPWCAPYFTRR